MRTNKDFCTDWMPTPVAKRMRYTWFAFVRAHYATIDKAQASVSNLRLTAKDPLADERIGPARNLLMISRAREARLDVIRKFEAVLELDLRNDSALARIRFRDKGVPFAGAGIAQLFNKLPLEQQRFEEEIQFELESPAPAPQYNVTKQPDVDLSEFFSMPMDEKIRLGIAQAQDIPSPDSPIAASAPESAAQLDSGREPAYPTLAIGGASADKTQAPSDGSDPQLTEGNT